jgi:hypothetical protein
MHRLLAVANLVDPARFEDELVSMLISRRSDAGPIIHDRAVGQNLVK